MRQLSLISYLLPILVTAQADLITYAGGSGNEVFNDVVQISNGDVLVIGAADALDWLPNGVIVTTLTNPGITNNQGTGRTPFILRLDSSLQDILGVYALPAGAAEDFRFIKSTNAPGTPTGDLYLSGTTEDSNTGGYFIGKLDNNFVNGAPTGFVWVNNVKCSAGDYPKVYQPWDVGNDGKVVYAYGDSHSYDWSAFYRMDANGEDEVVPHWRIHWIADGVGEYRGDGTTYSGGLSGLDYSAIVLKRDASRCELRSPTAAEYNAWMPDGNGGMKKGTWPLDILYEAECLPGGTSNTTDGPGYTGYSGSATFTHGPQSVCIDRRTNAMYIGFNTKSVLPGGEPDFEPAVMAMDADGALLWWSRLYHEVTPQGDTVNSSPDQYIDALAIDYSQPPATGLLVVNARCHGNNVENLWEGNTIAANPGASGFQNQFTGNQGNIHISWLGKLKLNDGTLMHSTYVAEYAEGTGSLGAPHPDPNLDGWPDPNGGWPNVNTTYLGKNMLKVTSSGRVVVLGQGRRTITTANAYQKMVKPANGGLSCWNNFVREYEDDLSIPLYSSLLVGQWDTLTQQGGDNVKLYGVFKNANSLLVVGKHTGSGNAMPTANVPAWGSSTFNGESAVLARFTAANIVDPGDSPVTISTALAPAPRTNTVHISPNPTAEGFTVRSGTTDLVSVAMLDNAGRAIRTVTMRSGVAEFDRGSIASGTYLLVGRTREGIARSLGKVVLR
ncbi:MAG: hypothetical protein KA791_06195 [Flavobacteriales bacterium]|nr:hypothetical protein [Flavobacteriales bacterium]